MDAEGRRVRRSHFFLRDSLLSNLTKNAIEGSDAQSRASLKIGLAAVGLGGVVAGAYALYKKYSLEEELKDLPGEVAADAQADPEIAADNGVSQLKKDSEALPDFKTPDVTPVKEEPTFWQRVKSAFSVESLPGPKPSQVGSASEALRAPTSVLVSKLPGEFRSKFAFTGIVGADKLSSMGSYTREEASKIVALKASGVSTKASGSMPKDVDALIRGFAAKHGVDPEQAVKIAKMESGGNPNAVSSTGAIGIYQFTGKTANDYGIRDRFDASQNAEAGVLLLKKSTSRLASDDLAPTPTNLYLVHQLGYSGAKELLKAAAHKKRISQLNPSLQKAIRLNAGGKSVVTAAEYIAKTTSAFETRATAVAVTGESSEAPPVVTPRTSVAQVVVDSVPSPSRPAAQVAKVDMADVLPKRTATVATVSRPSRMIPPKTPPVAAKKPQQVARLKNGTLVALEN